MREGSGKGTAPTKTDINLYTGGSVWPEGRSSLGSGMLSSLGVIGLKSKFLTLRHHVVLNFLHGRSGWWKGLDSKGCRNGAVNARAKHFSVMAGDIQHTSNHYNGCMDITYKKYSRRCTNT